MEVSTPEVMFHKEIFRKDHVWQSSLRNCSLWVLLFRQNWLVLHFFFMAFVFHIKIVKLPRKKKGKKKKRMKELKRLNILKKKEEAIGSTALEYDRSLSLKILHKF